MAVGAIVASLAGSGTVLAEMYYSRDADGTYHFSNVARPHAEPFVAGTAVASRLRNELREYERASAQDTEYQSLIAEVAARYGVEPELVRAVIRAESAFNRVAVSK